MRLMLLIVFSFAWVSGVHAEVTPAASEARSFRPECSARIASGETRRIALVIGNNTTKVQKIRNGINDARLIAEALTGLGFKVSSYADLTRQQFSNALYDFGKLVDDLCEHDVAAFYYAGNGFEIGRTAFMAVTESEYLANPESESKMLSSWIPLTEVLAKMEAHRGPKIVIIDTCRYDPFAGKRTVLPQDLLAYWRPPRNTLLAYATEPGQYASDGAPDSQNGPYAVALATSLRETKGPVEDVFRRVRHDVEAATKRIGNAQNPFIESGLETEVLLAAAPTQPRGAVARSIEVTRASRGVSNVGSERRVALVVGNSNYARVGTLRNPKNDAQAIAATLRRLKFEVDEQYDVDLAALQRTVRDFGDRVQDADWAVVYFAGHGIEYDQKPFILPTDARLAKDTDINLEALPVYHLLDKIAGARVLGLVIMDACRNNPFLEKMGRSTSRARNVSVSSGLPAVEPEDNVLVAYSAKHGFTAADGAGTNSPYVEALLEYMEKPGLEIDLVFRNVRDAVRRKTRNQQQPFTYSSLPGEGIYFVPGMTNGGETPR